MENGLNNLEGGDPPTYEEAFPPLGSPTLSAAEVLFTPTGGNSYGKSQSAWPVKSIPSSTITQVRKLGAIAALGINT